MLEDDFIDFDGCRNKFVAEVSGNHGGSLSQALELIKAIAGSGADAVKFQTYRPESLTLDHASAAFSVDGDLWKGQTLFELYKAAQTPFEWHAELFACAREQGLYAFSSPFDVAGLELLETLDAPAYKVASCELVDLPLIRAIAQTGKPVVVSTGMATEAEIEEALETIDAAGGVCACLMHCVSAYPTSAIAANLSRMIAIKEKWDIPVGFSDHTTGQEVPLLAAAMGASLIEKHVKLPDDTSSVDAGFSATVNDVGALITGLEHIHQVRGTGLFGPSEEEMESYRFRRSLYFVSDLRAGDVIGNNHVRIVRPSGGLHSRHLTEVIGQKLVRDVQFGDPVRWADFEN